MFFFFLWIQKLVLVICNGQLFHTNQFKDSVFLIGKHLGEKEEAACFNYGISKVFMKYKIPLLKMK